MPNELNLIDILRYLSKYNGNGKFYNIENFEYNGISVKHKNSKATSF